MNQINEGIRERNTNIDQFRELLFGDQIRQYEGRFKQLEAKLSNLHEEMDKRIDDLQNILTSDLNSAIESLDKKIHSFVLTSREEQINLQQRIKSTSSKLENRFQLLSDEVEENVTILRENFLQVGGKIKEDIQTLKTQVYEELNRRFASLEDVQVSKDDMAEILFNVGMKIKGVELVSSLQDADAPEALPYTNSSSRGQDSDDVDIDMEDNER